MTYRLLLVCVPTFLLWIIAQTLFPANICKAMSVPGSGNSAAAISPGISIDVPERAPSSGPVPLRVAMVADMQTYYANNGILDKALNIVLVRRDAPGVQLVAKLDPHVHMQPESPLPPPPSGTDLSKAGFIKEERSFDALGFGARHDGAADYYVLASFAGYLSTPMPLTVEDKSHSLSARDAMTAPLLTDDVKKTVPLPPESVGVVAQIKDGPVPVIVGALRVAVKSAKFPGEPSPAPFVTIVAVYLAPSGGMSARSFIVDSRVEGGDFVAQFSIPVEMLAPQPKPGKYKVLVFSGDERTTLLDLLVPEKKNKTMKK